MDLVDLWELIEHKTCKKTQYMKKTAKGLYFAQNSQFLSQKF